MTKTIRIDREHTRKLLAGETVAIKVPAGCTVLRLKLDVPEGEHTAGLAKVLDVFFNGRAS